MEAGIHTSSYERLKLKDAQFRRQIEAAQKKLIITARSKLAAAIEKGDMPTVRWFLERKVPEEFRPKFDPDDLPPPNVTVILPGSKPHPRITPA